jgi:hypothetical protein
MMEEDIKNLVVEGFLVLRELSGYRCALGQDVATPDFSEIVVFVDFFHHKSGVPIHWFVRDLLQYHDAQVHHLTPNGIMLLAMFISYCEDFVGIEPH